MCSNSSGPDNSMSAQTTVAAAPAPPAPSPEEPDIGVSRKEESRENFEGKDAPDYRSNRTAVPIVSPAKQIRM